MRKKERNSTFELLRIISMFMIIVWHIIIHADLNATTGANKEVISFIYIVFSIHVNLFVLITGYFQYKKEISYEKFFRLWGVLWFYKAVFACIFQFSGIEKIEKMAFIKELLPLPTNSDYWFIKCFLILYLLIPYLNLLIKNLSYKQHKKLVYLVFILYSVIAYITRSTTLNNDGYTVANFIMLYFIGAYLGKYPIKDNMHFKNYTSSKKRVIFLSLSIFFGIFNFLLYKYCDTLLEIDSVIFKEFGHIIRHSYTKFNNPLIIIQAIFFFLYFESLTIKSKLINRISQTVLGIYLIHENHHIYNIIYQYTPLSNQNVLYSRSLIIQVFILAIIIFVVCMLIEGLRIIITRGLEKLKIVKMSKSKIKNYINTFNNEVET